MAAAAPKRGLPEKRRMRHDRHYVDELTQRMGEGIGRMVPLDMIASNQDQPRSNLGDLTDLVGSIEVHGILEPLLVRKREGGQYELVSGERRFHAAMEAGLDEVPCIELDVSDEHALEIALIENLQREDLSPFEEAEGFKTLIDKYGYTHEQVAGAVGRSRVTITESMKILTVPPEIRSECRHADITAKGMLLEIAKAGNPDAMRELIRDIVELRLDRAAVRERRKRDDESGLTEETPIAEGEKTPDDAPRTGGRSRPFVWKYQPQNRNFRVSLSFATEKEPAKGEVIAALESLLEELRQEGD